MPCHAAVSENVITVLNVETVESVLALMRKACVRHAVILDEQGLYEGVCSSKAILNSLIPVSVAMADGVQLDVKVTAAPGVAKRYRNVKPLCVTEVMDRRVHKMRPDSPIWEGVAHLSKYHGPIAIVDDSNKYFGLITYDSMLEHLDTFMPKDG